MTHNAEGLARRCNAWDLFIVAGGLQCGNCGAHNVQRIDRSLMCSGLCQDEKPCPLQHDGPDGLCWVHRIWKEGENT